jgi:hypothetical protein
MEVSQYKCYRYKSFDSSPIICSFTEVCNSWNPQGSVTQTQYNGGFIQLFIQLE